MLRYFAALEPGLMRASAALDASADDLVCRTLGVVLAGLGKLKEGGSSGAAKAGAILDAGTKMPQRGSHSKYLTLFGKDP